MDPEGTALAMDLRQARAARFLAARFLTWQKVGTG
jgi:hypothetical protein